MSAGTPTALAIQGFSPHSLGLQLAAPPPQQQQQQIPTQQQQQTISLSGSQSQLNKSAPPFKPASQKQQQQTVTAPTQQPQQQPGGPLPQQTSSQPNTPTQVRATGQFYCVNISYLVDQCICPARSRSRQTLDKNVLSWALTGTGSVFLIRQVS